MDRIQLTEEQAKELLEYSSLTPSQQEYVLESWGRKGRIKKSALEEARDDYYSHISDHGENSRILVYGEAYKRLVFYKNELEAERGRRK